MFFTEIYIVLLSAVKCPKGTLICGMFVHPLDSDVIRSESSSGLG